jgi:hypothetical protein
MNSNLHLLHSKAQIEAMLQRAQARRPAVLDGQQPHRELIVRHAGAADRADLEHLAQLEGRALRSGATLLAERRGEVLAAVSIESGEAIADPFRPTADLVELLLRSRAHLRGEPERPGPPGPLALLGRLASLHRGPAGAPAVPGSEYMLIR